MTSRRFPATGSAELSATRTPIAHATRILLLGALAIGTVYTMPTMAQQTTTTAPAATRTYNIPAGSLDQVLGQFGRDAGVMISIDSSLTQGLRSPGLQGNHDVANGLNTILSPHQLEAIGSMHGGYKLQRKPAGNTATLPAVSVTASVDNSLPAAYAGGQVAKGGSLGLLGTQDTMNTPFSTINYTSELIEDQQANTLADLVINDASIRMTTGSGGFSDEFQIRGFGVSAGDVGFNGMYGLISSSRVPAQLIERAEILKGPGALMNGMPPGGSVGGAINTVIKRAKDTPLTRLTTTYQSESNVSLHLDTGRRFGENNTWGLRFNGLVRDGEGNTNGNDQEMQLGAIALDYRGEKLRWSLDVISQNSDIENYRPQISLDTSTGIIPDAPNGDINFFPGTSLQQSDTTVATRVDYDFSDSLTGFIAIGYREGENEQIFPTLASSVIANGNFQVRSSFYDSYSETKSAAAGLRWNFNTGNVKHNVSVGFNHLKQESGSVSIPQTTAVDSNIYNPVPIPIVTAVRTEPRKTSESTNTSFAISDTMAFANDRLFLTLGARNQKVESVSFNTTTGAVSGTPYSASSITPVAAIVFKPVENVSLYANYTAGLSRGSIVGPGYNNTGEVLAPFKSKQYEGGVKIDWGRVITTASVYQIARPSIMNDTTTVPMPTRGYFGEQRNRGIEFTAYGELQRGLRGMTSIAFVDSELVKTNNGVNQGNRPAGVPDLTASASLDWDTPWLAGLALNSRAIYTSGSYQTAANTTKFNSWTRFDIGARYRTIIGGKSVAFRANIENVMDKNYWISAGGYVALGSPRTFVVSAAIDF